MEKEKSSGKHVSRPISHVTEKRKREKAGESVKAQVVVTLNGKVGKNQIHCNWRSIQRGQQRKWDSFWGVVHFFQFLLKKLQI